jgi:hypothetical protein
MPQALCDGSPSPVMGASAPAGGRALFAIDQRCATSFHHDLHLSHNMEKAHVALQKIFSLQDHEFHIEGIKI